jgi:integrase
MDIFKTVYGNEETDRRRLNNSLETLKNHKEISKKNKELIIDFIERCLKSSHRPKPIKPKRAGKYSIIMRNLVLKLGKDLDKATKEDLEILVEWLEKREDFTDWTKHDYKVALKKFYKTMYGDPDDPMFTPKIVRFIRTTMDDKPIANPKELPRPEEINKMVSTATHIRDKAFVRTIFETGMRIGEMLKMKINDIDLAEGYIWTEGVKTKWSNRVVPIEDSIPLLSQWIDSHPYKDNKKAPVWVSVQAKYGRENDETIKYYPPITYARARDLLKEIGKMAGIDKRLNPHAFRKGSATSKGSKMSYTDLCVTMGWKIGSDEASTYVRPTREDLKNGSSNTNLKKKCFVCDKDNDSTTVACIYCGSNMKKDEKEQLLLKILMKPHIKEAIKKEMMGEDLFKALVKA